MYAAALPRIAAGSTRRFRDHATVAAAATMTALAAGAMGRQLVVAGRLLPAHVNPWLVAHLATVLPALPLGAWVLVRRKGDRAHRLLGRAWALLMVGAALSSFGLHGMTGGFSWIHLLSALTLVAIPRAVWAAMRGNIAGHVRGMRAVFIGLVSAGLFAFVPGRLFGAWLFG